MNLTTNDLLIVIGEQTLQIKALQMMNDIQAKKLAELEPKNEFELNNVEK